MIRLEKLNKVYSNGYEALKSIDVEIPDGDLVCLLGPSGCGKTTILNLICGLLDPTKGDILFDGESVIHKHPKDRNIGLVFQNYALYPHMTVLENIMFPLRVGKNKLPREEARKIAQKYMAITSIEEFADKKPGAMSGGQQQRVAITRALVQNPKILLLDEPLSNLDARLRLKIREEIRRLVKEIGITTIFVTHDQEEALSISDRIVLMDTGVVQQYDEPQNLYLEPDNLFVAKFMGNPIINIYEMEKAGTSFHGAEFSISMESLKAKRIKGDMPDGKYYVGIRPEHLSLCEKGTGDFTVSIESIELIGKDRILNFSVNGAHSKSVVTIATAVVGGDVESFRIAYESIYIFREDGSRVY